MNETPENLVGYRVVVQTYDGDVDMWFQDFEGEVIAQTASMVKVKRYFSSRWLPINGPLCRVQKIIYDRP